LATRQSAQDLYGAEVALSVEQAWAAVGVGASPSSSSPPAAPSTPAPSSPSPGGLKKGVPLTGIGGPAGAFTVLSVSVPQGVRGLSFRMSGGTGDADLYVRHGAAPTTSRWDYRPFLEGNDEAVSAQTVAGTWYVMVRGYTAFGGVSLLVDWTM
jgi:serine protease